MLKNLLYSLEGKLSKTKVGIIIVTIVTALLTADLPENYEIILKIIGIFGAAIATIGFRDALSKVSVELKNLIDKLYKEMTENK